MKNHYQTLGIKRNATDDNIKSAYRKLAFKFHPDKNNGDKFFEERFKEIQEAYEILSDPYEKGKYDANYDFFFNYNWSQSSQEESKYEAPKPDPEKVKKKKEEQERRNRDKVEKERVANIKKNAELLFEDKAWIFLGNWFIIPGAVGLWMFIKYRSEGYTKKSNSVCSLTIISFICFLILAVILTIGSAFNK